MKVTASPDHVAVLSNGFRFAENDEESSESSSIGVESSSEDRGDSGGGEEEVESKQSDGPLGSLECLEDSLPIKRGLSNFFAGKSKSFVSLLDVSTADAGDLAKPENPFNKRRRILNAHSVSSSWAQRRASYRSLLPPLEVAEVEDDDDDEETSEDSPLAPLPPNHHHGKPKRAFRSPRSSPVILMQQSSSSIARVHSS